MILIVECDVIFYGKDCKFFCYYLYYMYGDFCVLVCNYCFNEDCNNLMVCRKYFKFGILLVIFFNNLKLIVVLVCIINLMILNEYVSRWIDIIESDIVKERERE